MTRRWSTPRPWRRDATDGWAILWRLCVIVGGMLAGAWILTR